MCPLIGMMGRHCPRLCWWTLSPSLSVRGSARVRVQDCEAAGVLTKSAERDWPGILNAEAAKGWRLVTVDQSIAFSERRNG